MRSNRSIACAKPMFQCPRQVRGWIQHEDDGVKVEQVLNEFKKSGALLEGHFILSSGLHSDKFLQKALVFQDAKRTAKLCKARAAKVKKEVADEITAIGATAVGGI